MRWRYTGEDRALLDIPARDIYADENLTPEQIAVIEASDLYVEAGK